MPESLAETRPSRPPAALLVQWRFAVYVLLLLIASGLAILGRAHPVQPPAAAYSMPPD
jgi:hypothetical protein